MTPTETLILRFLKTEGPADAHQIAAAIGVSYRSLYASRRSNLPRLRADQLIHIAEYRRQDGHGGAPVPVFKYGKGIDAQRPEPLTKQEKNARAKRIMNARNPDRSIISVILGTAKARPQGIGPVKSELSKLFNL